MNATIPAEIDNLSEAILEAAVRAPSSHNSQPWRFRVDPGAIQLFADRTRALPVNDPYDRELIISCGCALLNMRIAAAGSGVSAVVNLLPDPNDADQLATVRLRSSTDIPESDAVLDEYIERRRTYRKRFEPNLVSDAILDELTAAAVQEGATLTIVFTESQRHELAVLIAEGDAALWANPSWRRELAAWMHPRRSGDGLIVPWIVAPFAHAVIRSFDMGHGQAAKDSQITEASPLLAVLSTPGDGVIDWLKAGQALGRVLLDGCRHDLQASYLNQPVQVPALRQKLQHQLGIPGFPQIVLRLGHPIDQIPATPRRPLEAVLDAHIN